MKTQIARLVAAVMFVALAGCSTGEEKPCTKDLTIGIGVAEQELSGNWTTLGWKPGFVTPNGQYVDAYAGPGEYVVWYEEYNCVSGSCSDYVVVIDRFGYLNNAGRDCVFSKPQGHVNGSDTPVYVQISPHPEDPAVAMPTIALVGQNVAALPALDPYDVNRNAVLYQFSHRPRLFLGDVLDVTMYVDCGVDPFDDASDEFISSGINASWSQGYWYGTQLGATSWSYMDVDGMHAFSAVPTIDGAIATMAFTAKVDPAGGLATAASGYWHKVDTLIK